MENKKNGILILKSCLPQCEYLESNKKCQAIIFVTMPTSS